VDDVALGRHAVDCVVVDHEKELPVGHNSCVVAGVDVAEFAHLPSGDHEVHHVVSHGHHVKLEQLPGPAPD
jgi:hypothetical protein